MRAQHGWVWLLVCVVSGPALGGRRGVAEDRGLPCQPANDRLRTIARELVEAVKRNATIY